MALGALRERWAEDTARSPADRDKLFDMARRSYQQALEIDPKYLPAYAALAGLYEKLNDYELAQASYRGALKVQPKDANIWFDILASIAFILGGGNLLKIQLKKVSDRQAGWAT